MARVRPKVAVTVLAATFLLSMGAGFAWSRATAGDDVVRAEQPGVYDQPGSIVAAPQVDGADLPDVAVTDLAGDDVRTRELLGQPLLLNFWFSTCVPCREEMPDLAAVHAELGDDVRFVGINPFDTPAAAERFARSVGVGYELLLDHDSALASDLGIAVFPATLLVAPDGTIVDVHLGAVEADELRSAIEEHLLS